MLTLGLRIALLRRPASDPDEPGPAAWLLLPCLLAALQLAADFVAVGTDGRWWPQGLLAVLFPVALIPLASALLCLLGGTARVAALAGGWLAAAVVIELPDQLRLLLRDAEMLPTWLGEDGSWIGPAWLALAGIVYALRIGAVVPRRAWLALPLAAAALLGPLTGLYRDGRLWIAAESGAQEDEPVLASEQAFYEQPQLLDAALRVLAPQRPGRPDLYFIGMAGYAPERVFLREVKAVGALMDNALGSAGRSVLLANSADSVLDLPIASVTALRASLRAVGAQMDPEEDILFLFMTSHGSRDHQLALEFWPLRFDTLDPALLRDLLDEAGIRWRVIVVSACYSGGYIDALRDERSIVITAAAPDRSSFGCANENDWTHFGEAFFDHALRREHDLERAFALAQARVSEREQAEHVEQVSDPRIAVGAAMREKWAQYLRSLRVSGGSAQAGIQQAIQ